MGFFFTPPVDHSRMSVHGACDPVKLPPAKPEAHFGFKLPRDRYLRLSGINTTCNHSACCMRRTQVIPIRFSCLLVAPGESGPPLQRSNLIEFPRTSGVLPYWFDACFNLESGISACGAGFEVPETPSFGSLIMSYPGAGVTMATLSPSSMAALGLFMIRSSVDDALA